MVTDLPIQPLAWGDRVCVVLDDLAFSPLHNDNSVCLPNITCLLGHNPTLSRIYCPELNYVFSLSL